MKLQYFFLIAVPFMLLQGCGSFKGELIQSGERNEAIQNAILDFSNTSRLYRKDTVFSVHSEKMNENFIGVSIGKNNTKLLLTANAKVGTKSRLPSRFVEKEGKLFFWWDDNYPLTEEALAVFRKYNLLQDDEGGVITVPDFTIDDAQKGVHYYFCLDDLSKYRKVTTNKGMGYYDPPQLKCDQ